MLVFRTFTGIYDNYMMVFTVYTGICAACWYLRCMLVFTIHAGIYNACCRNEQARSKLLFTGTAEGHGTAITRVNIHSFICILIYAHIILL